MKLNSLFLLVLLAVPFSNISADEDKAANTGLSVGAGFGIPYGILGINAEYRPIDIFGVTGCIGTIFIDGLTKCFGVSIYPPNTKKNFEPRLSVIYGHNGLLIAKLGDDTDFSVHEGWSVGGGIVAGGDQHKVTLDLFVVVSSGVFDEEDRLKARGFEVNEGPLPAFMNRIKTSVGYRYAF